MTLIMPNDPLTPTDPLGFPITYPPYPNWGLGGLLGGVFADPGLQTWSEPSQPSIPQDPAAAEQPLLTAVKNAAASGALRGFSDTMQGTALLNTTLPVVGPLYNEMLRYPQMTRDERLRLHRAVNDAGLSMPRKNQIHSALIDSGRGKPLPSLEDFGAYDPEQSAAMQYGRALNDWVDQNFPISPENQQRLPVTLTQGVSAAAPLALAAPLGGVGLLGAAGYVGAMGAGAEAQRAKAAGASPEQQADAANRGALLGAGSVLVPFGAFSMPIRLDAPGLFRSAVNWLSPYARGVAASAATNEPLRYLSNEIAKTYDPNATYEYDPERSLEDVGLGIIMPFAQRRLPILTPQQDLQRVIYNLDQRILEKLAPGHSLLNPPQRIDFVPTTFDKMAMEDAKLSAAAQQRLEMNDHHWATRQLRPTWNRVGITPDDWTSYMPTPLHRYLPDGLHTGPNHWNADQIRGVQGLPPTQQSHIELLADMIRQLWARGWPP